MAVVGGADSLSHHSNWKTSFLRRDTETTEERMGEKRERKERMKIALNQ